MSSSDDRLEALVSNVCFAQVAENLDAFRRKVFHNALKYSAWPVTSNTTFTTLGSAYSLSLVIANANSLANQVAMASAHK